MQKAIFGSISQKLELHNFELDCYILDDLTRVVGKSKFEKALGLDSKSKTGLYDFLLSLNKYIPIADALLNKVSNPICFKMLSNDETLIAETGYPSEVFLDVCLILLKAKNEGYLAVNQLKIGKNSEKILIFLNNKNINCLIDTASGFNFFKEKTKEKFKNSLLRQKEDTAFEWVITFTDEFYEGVFVFTQTNWQEFRKSPIKLADFIYNTIFMRIDDKILDQVRVLKPKRSYVNKNGFLLNREHPKLQIFNQTLQSFFIESNYERSEFMQIVIKNFPKNTLRENLTFIEEPLESLSLFNEKLQIGLTRV
jgi:hypothetical protein